MDIHNDEVDIVDEYVEEEDEDDDIPALFGLELIEFELSEAYDPPVTHNIKLSHGTKPVVALDVDPSGARCATGSTDGIIKFWDFAGMASALESFRTVQLGRSPILDISYSANGVHALVVSASSQATVLSRDGIKIAECAEGNKNLFDMEKTRGHVAGLLKGKWNPRDTAEFLTCSLDGTCRIWNSENVKQHKAVIKCRSQNRSLAVPTTCTYSRDGNLVVCACNDGSIRMWDQRRKLINTSAIITNGHEKGTQTSSVAFAYDGKHLATRGGDSTLKLWDVRLTKKPILTKDDLPSQFASTDCAFSPNDKVIFTGIPLHTDEVRRHGGRIMFFSRNYFDLVYLEDILNTDVIRIHWHPKLNQIIVGAGDGNVYMFYDPTKSRKGAMLCLTKPSKKRKREDEVMPQPQ